MMDLQLGLRNVQILLMSPECGQTLLLTFLSGFDNLRPSSHGKNETKNVCLFYKAGRFDDSGITSF